MDKKTLSKIAVVTGGSSGIGKAIAEKLSKAEIKVVVADLHEFEPKTKNIFFKKCDVSQANEIDDLYSWISKKLGKPEILVLNAGRGIKEKLTEGDPEKWQNIIDINLMGPLRCIRSFVPNMLHEKRGSVIFISSVAANQAFSYGGIYSASKTALEVIAETLRQETLPHVKVTVISPGIVDTNFFGNEISGNTKLEEMGMGSISAEEIAEDVWYVLNKERGTSINKIITRPVKQNF